MPKTREKLTQADLYVLRRRYAGDPEALAWLDRQADESTPARPGSTTAAKPTNRKAATRDRSRSFLGD
jgi:hypothetical protein